MSQPVQRVVVVGASLAGARAAEALRLQGFTGEITLVGEESLRPYERPSLSKATLLDEGSPEPQWVHPEDFYASNGISLITGVSAVGLRPGTPLTVELKDGTEIEGDAVLLTTGGSVRRLAGTASMARVFYLRDWSDAMRLRNALRPGLRVAVVGSGFIGAEIASSAAQAGCVVQLLEALPALFPGVRSDAVKAALQQAHERSGVVCRSGVAIVGVNETDAGVLMATASGESIEADIVVVGIGIELRTELALAAGAVVEHGVLVDMGFRTSVPGLYAAGDVATLVDTTGRRLHVEHWKGAQEQGAAAAASILGAEVMPPPVPWFWSDQCGQRIEVAGHPAMGDNQILREVGPNEICTFHLRHGVLVGATGWNAPRLVRSAMPLIQKAVCPDADHLADPTRPLNKVALVPALAVVATQKD